jgi:hypothetical protein
MFNVFPNVPLSVFKEVGGGEAGVGRRGIEELAALAREAGGAGSADDLALAEKSAHGAAPEGIEAMVDFVGVGGAVVASGARHDQEGNVLDVEFQKDLHLPAEFQAGGTAQLFDCDAALLAHPRGEDFDHDLESYVVLIHLTSFVTGPSCVTILPPLKLRSCFSSALVVGLHFTHSTRAGNGEEKTEKHEMQCLK